MTFRRRTYPELVDNLLTGIVAGISAETHPFPPTPSPPFTHVLEHQSVAQIVSIYGSHNGQPHRFLPDSDFSVVDKTITWIDGGGALPDAGTLISVNYMLQESRAAITDIYPGSVLRTLSETVALEIGRLYAQLEAVYRAGFIDTATGSALDNVVALLGIERVTGNHPVGEVVFTRADSSRGVITIPAGTRIMTEDGEVEYETTEMVTLLAGQKTVRARAQDIEPTNAGVEADTLTVLPIPIAGIERVSNNTPTQITAQAESDTEVRTRAKNFLSRSERATVGALRHAVERQGVSAEIIENTATPGIISVNTFSDDLPPELQQRIITAIEEARPAGVFVTPPAAQPIGKVALSIRLETADGLLPTDLRAIQTTVRENISDFFATLPTKANASLNKLIGAVLSVGGVEDMQLLSATLDGTALDTTSGQLQLAGKATELDGLDLADPALPTLLSLVIRYPAAGAPPDEAQISTSLSGALSYLNERSLQAATPIPVTWEKLLLPIPLAIGGKETATLAAFDADPSAFTLLGDAAPFDVTFAITQESGLTQLLNAAGDSYALTPFEQLSLVGVELVEEA